jgi:hypothetical protein
MDPTAGQIAYGSLFLDAIDTTWRIGFTEFRTPFVVTSGRIASAELRTPFVISAGRIGVAEFSSPLVLTAGRIGATELRTPFVISAGRIGVAAIRIPNFATSGKLAYGDLFLDITHTSGRVGFVRFGAPLAAAVGCLSFTSLQTPKDALSLFVPSEGRINIFEDATLLVLQDAGQVSKISISSSGVNYSIIDDITITVQHGSGRTGEAALCSPILGAVTKYPGRYTTTRGFLSSDKYLQDITTYNDYTYAIRAPESFERYESLIRDILHPAGFQMIGQFVVTLDDAGFADYPNEDPIITQSVNPSGCLSFMEFEVPANSTAGRAGFIELELPLVVTLGRAGFAELKAPLIGTSGQVSFGEFFTPDSP